MSCFSHFRVSFLRGGGGGRGGRGGGSWFFAYHCGICHEGWGGGARKKAQQIVGDAMRGGFQKLQGKKTKIIIVPPLHKL